MPSCQLPAFFHVGSLCFIGAAAPAGTTEVSAAADVKHHPHPPKTHHVGRGQCARAHRSGCPLTSVAADDAQATGVPVAVAGAPAEDAKHPKPKKTQPVPRGECTQLYNDSEDLLRPTDGAEATAAPAADIKHPKKPHPKSKAAPAGAEDS